MSAENTTEEDLRLQESRLCSRCRAVNFDGRAKEFPFRLSELDQTCHSCLLLRALLWKESPSTGDKIVLKVCKGRYTRALRMLPSDRQSELSCLGILQRGSIFGRQVRWLVECPESKDIHMSAIIPRLVDSKRADFNLVKDWMNNCNSSHNCAALRTSRGIIPNQYVIDCYTRKVVPAPHECEYAALSYVWGRNQTTFYPGDTLDVVPKTIEDAIQVTRIMGIAYLWIDRYCIRQDNTRHKMEQIHSMHKIYSNASFTIVAAAGDTPDHGLPGVSDRYRCEQPRVHLGSRLMVSTLSDPSDLICSSKWWTRGWTYQECMHSTRLLFFTEEQLYFQCKNASFRESISCPANNDMEPNPIFGIIQRLDIWSCTNQYLNRDLTFPSDILDAIFSVLQRFQDEISEQNFRHVWGLPVQKDLDYPRSSREARDLGIIIQQDSYCPESWTEAFSRALLWTFGGSATRREGFPSWSWTGWFGNDLTPNKHRIHLRADLDLYNITGGGIRRHLPEFMLNASGYPLMSLENFFIAGHDSETPSSVLRVKARVVRLRLELGEFDSRVGGRLYALDSDGEPIFLETVLQGGDFSKQSSGCRLDKAVQGSEANHLGIILGSDYAKRNVFLLVVEEKGTLFERIGVCSALHEVVFHSPVLRGGTMSSVETQVRTISLG